MRKTRILYLFLLALCCGTTLLSYGQRGLSSRIPRPGGAGGGKGDSLQKRDPLADSITINFRFLDSSRMQKFDSSIYDFYKRYPTPWQNINLGNVGTATHSLVFSPLMNPGFDPGFHAYDTYNFNVYDTRFYNTTRPYSEINYLLGSAVEQIIDLKHTQNVMPNWNIALEYRLISSPGTFVNQTTNHNNYRVASWYQSKNKRYQNFFVVIGNKLQSGENGGIRNDENYLDSIGFDIRSTIPSKLGPQNQATSRNFFSSYIPTGTMNTNASYLMRQQYDIGQKDSIVTDSSVIPLFYPRLRIEHTIDLKTYNYRFVDNYPDSVYYFNNYGINPKIPFRLRDSWNRLINDLSFYTFPDARNSQQFFKAGASVEMLKGTFDTGTVTHRYTNFSLHGEYRNKTRNQKWDVEAYGNLYLAGLNSGDYDAHISLKRLISKKIGYLQAGFGNVNRSPSFIYDSTSSFMSYSNQFKKENNTEIFGSLDLPRLRLKLEGKYLLMSNYIYFASYKKPEQYATLFNMLQISVEKQFNLTRHLRWRTWTVFQQLAGAAPVNVPLILTRNQIGYDGKLGFRNLLISFGLEFRYYTPYKADLYSPLLGQFVYQDTATMKMEVPEIGAYVHFRIKSFTAYIRAENLNTFNFSKGNFTNNNIVIPDYPYPGLQIRLGVYWSFIN